MKIHTEFAQQSVEWMIARAGKPTASEFDQLLTPEFEIRKGQMPKTYLWKKLAEAWIGGPLMGANVFDMEIGKILEDEAKPFYTLTFDEEIQSVGLVTTDDGRIACSPDGLIGNEGGIEIKCPHIETHVGYLLNGELPKDYAAQVHGSMFVTGRPWWKFMSYRRHMSPLVKVIERDDEIQKKISEALVLFLESFDKAMARLVEMNGGLPRRRIQST